MFEEKLVPLSQGTAERFMAIANHRLIGNSAHAPDLPSSWMTLYELTKVPDKALDNAFRDGTGRENRAKMTQDARSPSLA